MILSILRPITKPKGFAKPNVKLVAGYEKCNLYKKSFILTFEIRILLNVNPLCNATAALIQGR